MSIGGPNTIVEIDESQFSRRKNNRRRVFPAPWVFCRETGESFTYAVAGRIAAALLPIIQVSVLPERQWCRICGERTTPCQTGGTSIILWITHWTLWILQQAPTRNCLFDKMLDDILPLIGRQTKHLNIIRPYSWKCPNKKYFENFSGGGITNKKHTLI